MRVDDEALSEKGNIAPRPSESNVGKEIDAGDFDMQSPMQSDTKSRLDAAGRGQIALFSQSLASTKMDGIENNAVHQGLQQTKNARYAFRLKL